jgi:hypothetical protein
VGVKLSVGELWDVERGVIEFEPVDVVQVESVDFLLVSSFLTVREFFEHFQL